MKFECLDSNLASCDGRILCSDGAIALATELLAPSDKRIIGVVGCLYRRSVRGSKDAPDHVRYVCHQTYVKLHHAKRSDRQRRYEARFYQRRERKLHFKSIHEKQQTVAIIQLTPLFRGRLISMSLSSADGDCGACFLVTVVVLPSSILTKV
jgi:hypothetical protein